MIEHDVVPVYVAELVGIEVELSGRHTFLHVSADSGAAMNREILGIVGDRGLRAPDVTVLIVERRENRHHSKLSGIKVVFRVLVKAIFRNGDVLCQLMNDANVPLIVVFGFRVTVPVPAKPVVPANAAGAPGEIP